MTEFVHRNASEALSYLMEAVMRGDEVGSRNGRVMELLFSHVVLTNPLEREIVTPLRKASLPAQIAETAWVLAGRSDVEWLSHYLPRAKDFSDDGETWRGGYGPRLRRWGELPQGRAQVEGLDQLQFVVDLLRADPLSRRAVVALYDPSVDSAPGKDIPCNDWLHFVSRLGALDLHVATRSNDLMWGWSGINAFEWSALLEVVAELTGMVAGELHFSISSLHLYDRHWGKASQIAQLGDRSAIPRYPVQSPRFHIKSITELDGALSDWFDLEQAIRKGGVVRDRIEDFPDPMLRSWLQVLAWWWTQDESYLDSLIGTALYVAALQSPRMDKPVALKPALTMEAFTRYVSELHEAKHLAYGDSWKRRGEQIGILANIARKVDRMGKNGGGDDPADTAIDLLCYLIKYRWWLSERVDGAALFYDKAWGSTPSDLAGPVTEMLDSLQSVPRHVGPNLDLENAIERDFGYVEQLAEAGDPARAGFVMDLILNAHQLAYRLWLARETWKAGNSSRAWKGYDDEA